MANVIDNLKVGLGPLVEQLTDDFFPNIATFYVRQSTERPSGAVTYTWVRDDSLVGLRALIEPVEFFLERERPTAIAGVSGLTFQTGDYIVTLGKFYSDIDTTMKLEDERGVMYEVVGTTNDPLRLTTRLSVRRTSPRVQ
jgi:hypothetical protein